MLRFQDWGLIGYEEALSKQLETIQQIIETQEPGVLVFCSHPPIVTLGRKTEPEDVFAWKGEIKEISRGGRATYHGPSQLVVYPILNLEMAGEQRPAKDIGAFLRLSEQAIVETLRAYDIQASGKTTQQKSPDDQGSEETGVWVGRQKVASLGIAVKKWVTYHGAAINLDEDAQAFLGMKPCGFSRETMVSVEKLVGHAVDRAAFSARLKDELLRRL